jgi:6-phosphogluconolactonase
MSFARRGLSLGGKIAAALLLGAGAQMLTGCTGFFVYPGSTTTGTTGSSSSDFAYVSDSSTAGSESINGYGVSAGTLVAATGSPYSLGFVPQAMVVTPNDAYLYVANQLGGIYGYSITSGTGALNVINVNGSTELANDDAASIAVASNGNGGYWLLVLDNGTVAAAITVYSIQSNGTLTSTSGGANVVSLNSQSSTFAPLSIKVAPGGEYVAVALGQGGAEVFSFNESTGQVTAFAPAQGVNPNSTQAAVSAIGIDSNNYLYVAGTLGTSSAEVIESWFVSTTGSIAGAYTKQQPVGQTPEAIDVSLNGNYVYVANYNSSSISAFSISSGVLTPLNSGTAYTAPNYVSALGHDNSGNYLVALGYNTVSGTQIYTINSGGTLTPGNSAGSGGTVGSPPAAIAMTH